MSLRSDIRKEYEKGTDCYPSLQAARMIENELKVDPQYNTNDKVEPKADMKAKAKGASSLASFDKDLSSLEKAWSENANEMKAMQKKLQDVTTCIGIYSKIGHHNLSHLLII